MSDLRYEISDWHQLSQCKSNTSNALSIQVSDFINDARLSATRISVVHEEFGDLYTVLVNPYGAILHEDFRISTEQILNDLACFGFFVEFSQREHLSGNAIQKLMTLQTLGFDKIRKLVVKDGKLGNKSVYVVGFMVIHHPDWMQDEYEATASEYFDALQHGSAINLSSLSYLQNINWGWLNYVANIQDVLEDNK